MSNHGEDLSQFDISVQVRTHPISYSKSQSHRPKAFNFNSGDLLRFPISSSFFLSQEKDKLVAEVIRYVLFKTHHNSGCPIRREELTQLITKNYRQRNLPVLIINEAINKLSTIFGYEMRELQRARPSSNNHQGRNSQQVSCLLRYKKYVEDVNTAHLTGFTFVVLSIVHISGGKISEENLWQHLRRIGLDETNESHPVLGNTKQALEALVQQRYLQKDKQSDLKAILCYMSLLREL
ncbi:putative MAGE domain-containing protein [Rosa chinensis]|uniref:Putative MAGE domain-containing protein n=1 Tax=Rosa chinensis TaxID=74649 RepID=A0A2P6PIW3_ROSCH|nr:putative MAGE domain-containing protein [Rosa chinensis]